MTTRAAIFNLYLKEPQVSRSTNSEVCCLFYSKEISSDNEHQMKVAIKNVTPSPIGKKVQLLNGSRYDVPNSHHGI